MSKDKSEFDIWLETQDKENLNKLYDDYFFLMEAIGEEETLPYEDWLETHFQNEVA